MNNPSTSTSPATWLPCADTSVPWTPPWSWPKRPWGGITASGRASLIPDVMIAFEVNVAAVIAFRGYSTLEQGKAPEFVLEIASPSTGRQDEERKREGYQDYGVQEYWRFDPSGGHFHRQSLAGTAFETGPTGPWPLRKSTRACSGDAARCWG